MREKLWFKACFGACVVTRGNKNMSYCHALLAIYQPLILQRDSSGIKLEKTFFYTYDET